MAASTTVSIPFTDAPKWLEKVEIEREGGIIRITPVKRSGYAQAEAEIDAEEFFRLIDKLKE